VPAEDPLSNFIGNLAKKIQVAKDHKHIMEAVYASASATEIVKEQEDPFASFLNKIGNTISAKLPFKEPVVSTEQVIVNQTIIQEISPIITQSEPITTVETDQPVKDLAQKIKDAIEKAKLKAQHSSAMEQEEVTNISTASELEEPADKQITSYIDELEKIKDTGTVKQQKEAKTTLEELKEYIDKAVYDYSRKILDLGGGGGSVAVQYANGGVMNGDLNINGHILSGGRDISNYFGTGGGGGLTNPLVLPNNTNPNGYSLNTLDSGGAKGGSITMTGSTDGDNVANAGNINTSAGAPDGGHGGSIDLSGALSNGGSLTMKGGGAFGAYGGSINTSGLASIGDAWYGGSIDTSGGGDGPGGSINTSNGGGLLNLSGNANGAGGSINTSAGNNGTGGSINTSDMGGAIDTSTYGGSINTQGGGGGYNGGSINTSGGAFGTGGSINTSSHFGNGGSINLQGSLVDDSGNLAGGGSIDLSAGAADGSPGGSIISTGGGGGSSPGGTLNMSNAGGSINTSNVGGSINTSTEGGSINTSNEGGYINTSNIGGSINLGSDGTGGAGSINMYGGDEGSAGSLNTSYGGADINVSAPAGSGLVAGYINTSAGGANGGHINTSNGGGSIDTFGGNGGLLPGGFINTSADGETETGGYIDTRGVEGEGAGGSINTSGAAGQGGYINTSSVGGYIDTSGYGGYIQTTGYNIDYTGGYIDTHGTIEGPGGYIDTSKNGGFIDTHSDGIHAGGFINTVGNDDGAGGYINTAAAYLGDGGFIDTSNGGGYIDTRGRGTIQFGNYTTRTTLLGTATQSRVVCLPDDSGTLLLSSAYIAYTNQNTTFSKNVTINGNLTALGTSTFKNTIFTTTSALSVVNAGPGPALYVFQAAGTSDVASFYDGDGVEVLHVGNANAGQGGKVGINESYPAVELTVNGAISANKQITASGGNSNQWNSVYNSYNSISGRYTTLDYLSSNFIYLGGVYAGPNANSISTATPVSAMSGMYVEPISGYAGFYTNTPIAPLDVRGNIKKISSTPVTSYATTLRMQDNYLYLYTPFSVQQYVLSGSDTTLALVASAAIGSSVYGGTNALAVRGAYVYVSESQGIRVYNTTSNSIASAGYIAHPDNGSSIQIQGNYLFALAYGTSYPGPGRLTVYDISNPVAPVRVFGVVDGSLAPRNLIVQGQNLYYAYNTFGTAVLQKWNITDPRTPTSKGTASYSGSMNGLAVKNNFAYVCDSNALRVYSVVGAPVLVTTIAGLPSIAAYSEPIIDGDYLYIPCQIGAGPFIQVMCVMDISNPYAPKVIRYITSAGGGSYNMMVSAQIKGRYMYLSNGVDAINVYDLGGAYVQNLRAGSIETTSILVDNNATIAGNLGVLSDAYFARGYSSLGDSSINGTLTVNNSATFYGTISTAGNLFSPSFATFVKNASYPTLSSTLTNNSGYFNSQGTFASPGGFIIKGHSPDYSTSIQNLPGYGTYGLWLQNVNDMDPGSTLISDGRAAVTHAMAFRAGINNFTGGADHNHVQWQGAPFNPTQSWQMTNGGSLNVYGYGANTYTQRFMVHTLPQYQDSTTITATSGIIDTTNATLITSTDRLSGVVILLDAYSAPVNYNLITPGSVVGIVVNPGLVGLNAVTFNSQCTQVSSNATGTLTAYKFDFFIGSGTNWVPASRGTQAINLKSRANGGNPGVSLIASQIGTNPSTQYVGLTGSYRGMNKHALARFTTANILTAYKPGSPLTLWIPTAMPSTSPIGTGFITSDKIATFAQGTFPSGVRTGYFDAFVISVSGTDMEFALCNLMDSYSFENRFWPIEATGTAGWVLYGGTQDTVHRPTFGTTGFYFEREPWYFDGTNYLSGGMIKNVSLGNSESYGNYSYGLGFRGAVLGNKSGTFAGDYNAVYSDNSVALGGEGLISLSSTPYQAVVGKYNNPNNNALFVVGAGTNNTSRVNVLEANNNNLTVTGSLSTTQGIVCAPSTFTAFDTVTDAALIMDFTRGATSGGMYVRRSNGQQRSIFNYQDSTGNIDVGTFSNNINSVSIKAGGSGLTGYINFGTFSTSNVMRIIDNGNIGMGTITPNEKLTVVGNISASGIGYFNHITASTKSFLIDHPLHTDKKLQYGSLESPYHGVRLTGKSCIKQDEVIIQLPDYISALVHADNANIQLTNINHDKVLFVKRVDVPSNTFSVGVKRNWLDRQEYEFYWTFTAIRKDIPHLTVEC
jgi:hypothetical protein